MSYLKKPLSEETKDFLRISLSVRDEKLSPEPVCDFCADPHPVAVYASKKMSTGVSVPRGATCWRWCTCEACMTDIDAEDFPALGARVGQRLKRFGFRSGDGFGTNAIQLAIAAAIKDLKDNLVVQEGSQDAQDQISG